MEGVLLHRGLVVPARRVFEGPEALKLFSDISVNSFENFKLGQAKHVIHCSIEVFARNVKTHLSRD